MNISYPRLTVAAMFRALLLGAAAGIVTLIIPAAIIPAFITAGVLWGGSIVYSVQRAKTEKIDSEGVSNREGYKMGPLAKLENGIIDLIVEHDASYFKRHNQKQEHQIEPADIKLQNELRPEKPTVTPVEEVVSEVKPVQTPNDTPEKYR